MYIFTSSGLMLGLVLPTTIEEVTQPERARAMIALRRKYNLVTVFGDLRQIV